jgi:acetylornithine deacetylase/succinyl-diaminopimelate desuccinylase-like protein
LNGAAWLADNAREEIDAAFAVTEGTTSDFDVTGRPVFLGVQAAEKLFQNFEFEVTNPGGHSSRPVPDNAIYHLVRAVDRVSHYEFPVQLDDANRGYFSGMSKIVGGELGTAMTAVVANSGDAAAVAVLDKDSNYHAMLRTTCVATMLSAGHATNALPQRAKANINCRIFPGVPPEEILAQLMKVADDPAVTVRIADRGPPVTHPAPLTAAVMDPVRKVANQLWPGVPVVTALEPGGSDAQFMNAVGIPTYGIDGIFGNPDGDGMHGLNEKIRAQSLYEARVFLYRLIKLYAAQ